VKGAVAFKARTRALERKIGANEIDDVRGIEDFGDCFFWNATHGGRVGGRDRLGKIFDTHGHDFGEMALSQSTSGAGSEIFCLVGSR